jgi:hypothetical protein
LNDFGGRYRGFEEVSQTEKKGDGRSALLAGGSANGVFRKFVFHAHWNRTIENETLSVCETSSKPIICNLAE